MVTPLTGFGDAASCSARSQRPHGPEPALSALLTAASLRPFSVDEVQMDPLFRCCIDTSALLGFSTFLFLLSQSSGGFARPVRRSGEGPILTGRIPPFPTLSLLFFFLLFLPCPFAAVVWCARLLSVVGVKIFSSALCSPQTAASSILYFASV